MLLQQQSSLILLLCLLLLTTKTIHSIQIRSQQEALGLGQQQQQQVEQLPGLGINKAECVPGIHNVVVSSSSSSTTTTTTLAQQEQDQDPEQDPEQEEEQDQVVPTAPDTFSVRLRTSADLQADVVIEIHREWSPYGVDRFYQLMKDNYYNCAALFRVVPGFVVQFGIASEPMETNKWDTVIVDDDTGVTQSNVKGTITFATAGPNTRTTQVFINIGDNDFLDTQGFTPFGIVTDGLRVVETLINNPTPNTSGGVDQQTYRELGNEWILQQYPAIDIILDTLLEE